MGSRGSVVPFFNQLLKKESSFLPITDRQMTRFWITLQQGVDFVLKNFQRMHGGEIFVPKLPSVRIVDLAAAMAPEVPQKMVGIRPGEKIHEVMCPFDDSHLTIEFSDHFVIRPTIKFHQMEVDYSVNKIGEVGKPVDFGFEYHSGTNPHFLTIKEIIESIRVASQQDKAIAEHQVSEAFRIPTEPRSRFEPELKV
jgi:UDP-N-acetylglucosamine 4,6-dehydratase